MDRSVAVPELEEDDHGPAADGAPARRIERSHGGGGESGGGGSRDELSNATNDDRPALLAKHHEILQSATSQAGFGCSFAHRMLGDIAAYRRDYKGMIVAMRRAAANATSDKDDATGARLAQAYAYGMAGDPATERMIIVLEADPSNFDARFKLAQHLLAVGDDETATPTLRIAAGHPNIVHRRRGFNNLCDVYRRRALAGDTDGAVAGLRNLLATPTEPDLEANAQTHLAEALVFAATSMMQGPSTDDLLATTLDNARTAADRAVALLPSTGQDASFALDQRGCCADMLGDLSKANGDTAATKDHYTEAVDFFHRGAAACGADAASRQKYIIAQIKLKAHVSDDVDTATTDSSQSIPTGSFPWTKSLASAVLGPGSISSRLRVSVSPRIPRIPTHHHRCLTSISL